MRNAFTSAALGLAMVVTQTVLAGAQTEAQQSSHVRVLAANGLVREGRLLSLTSSEIVLLLDSLTVTLPLRDVRRIERVTHGARNGVLVGALTGLGVGMTMSCGSTGSDGGCSPLIGVMVAGIGAALGTAVGLIHQDARRSSNVIYAAPDGAARTEIPAVVLAGGAGGVLRRRDRDITAPAFQAAVQFPLSPRTSLEVEAMQWSWHRTRRIGAVADEAWRTLSLSSNVAWRIGTGRTAGTVTMGAGVQRSTLNQSLCIQACDALPYGRTFATYFVETTPLALVGGGAERVLTSKLVGFGNLRLVMGKESGVTAVAGVRVPFGGRSALVF